MILNLKTYLMISLHVADCKVLYPFSCKMKSTLVVLPRGVSMLFFVFKWLIDVVNVDVNGFYFLIVC